MHLQQSKAKSLKSGGPQYWFEGEPAHVTSYLEQKKTCPVILMTPYGPVETPFDLVHKDYKIRRVDREMVRANADHHRIQKGQSKESIGEAIRRWFNLKSGLDFERIELDHSQCFDSQARLILVPLEVTWRNRTRPEILPAVRAPLSFTSKYQSELWLKQIEACGKKNPDALDWTASQLKRFVQQHGDPNLTHVGEEDLLRTAGPLDHLGLRLGPYLRKGLDCPKSFFRFLQFPDYPCHIEIKKHSSGFKYQENNKQHYPQLPRAVILCLDHDKVHVGEHIDVIELKALAKHFSK